MEKERRGELEVGQEESLSLSPRLRMNTITLIAQRLRSNRSSEIQYSSSKSNNLFAH